MSEEERSVPAEPSVVAVYTRGGEYKLGILGVKSIMYHEPVFAGDTHYCDVFGENGERERVFDIRKVVWGDPVQAEEHNRSRGEVVIRRD